MSLWSDSEHDRAADFAGVFDRLIEEVDGPDPHAERVGNPHQSPSGIGAGSAGLDSRLIEIRAAMMQSVDTFSDLFQRLLGVYADALLNGFEPQARAQDDGVSAPIQLSSRSGSTARARVWVHNTTQDSLPPLRLRLTDLFAHDGCKLAAAASFDPPLVQPAAGQSVSAWLEVMVSSHQAHGIFRLCTCHRTAGRSGAGSPGGGLMSPAATPFLTTLGRYAELVSLEMAQFLGPNEASPYLYDLVRDYPSRGGKGIRPALLLSTCQAYGRSLDGALRAAVALEILHDAFLIHDDVEDRSALRRGRPTLHELHGVGLAVNAGDCLAHLALQPLLDDVGLSNRLKERVMAELLTVARLTTEGQALDLGWRWHSVVNNEPARCLTWRARRRAGTAPSLR